jgi:hypothetical protein
MEMGLQWNNSVEIINQILRMKLKESRRRMAELRLLKVITK